MSALLAVEALSVDFPRSRGWRHDPAPTAALRDVSFSLEEGVALGVIGESGSGKSTLARAILGLVRPSAGRIWWRGQRLDTARGAALRAVRRELQVVFQDPFGSLDPRMTAAESIAEALDALEGIADSDAARRRVDATLTEVGLDPVFGRRYPHQLSGGQCQRVAIARATIARPVLLICDEATSKLDVSVQAQIVNLLLDLRAATGMGLLFISHNRAVVRLLCDRTIELHEGRLVGAQGGKSS
jgi:peptide/nickel transport system ATP-binding protein